MELNTIKPAEGSKKKRVVSVVVLALDLVKLVVEVIKVSIHVQVERTVLVLKVVKCQFNAVCQNVALNR